MWFLIFLRDFVGLPAFLVAIFALIGALLQRKKLNEIVTSVFKVIVGFLILGAGAGVLIGSLNQFQPLFESAYSLQGIIPNNDAFSGLLANVLPKMGSLASLIMIVGMIMNLILAGFSRFRYVFVSGHMLYYLGLMLSGVFYKIGFDFENNPADFVISLFGGAAILSLYMAISPAMMQRYTRTITGTDEFGLGHTGSFGYAISGVIGEAVGKLRKGKITSTEAINFPKQLFFLRNILVSITLTIFIFYMLAFIPSGVMYELGHYTQVVDGRTVPKVGKEVIVGILSTRNWFVEMLIQAFTFTAGVEIILVGVRMFIGELVPLFKGISEKFIKRAKAAVDCPVLFPYAQNAVLIGFISSFLGGIVGLGITIGLSQGAFIPAVILPGLVPHFFLGATNGIYGNAKGGYLGAILAAFTVGILITFVPIIFILGQWVPGANKELEAIAIQNGGESQLDGLRTLNWGDTDYTLGIIPGVLGLINKWVGFAFALVVYGLLIIDGILLKFVPWWPRRKTPVAVETK
ncbi:PTS system ascorbate-specific IIC component [Mycoplasmoides fastidiosum]|uniref:Ascorbate-specific PTS system EIIC component n=1 Tax=Mycoplasmoides fastidiosum TaxID=92758 RepID=A0ABU0LZC8_9BACT|nr:PTS ascorbate transporter subunit IIC [Mycoplasmoides fastidiosum]MDQ0513958.1 PTS system ascorbate-specific IIC component [Mycoplasmoides fastidiosum]UUD37628.1 PTS ascorbate transporter subunit IIC [Mycoplasmoides fastidiosum]